MSSVTRSVIVRLRAEMAQFKKEWNDGTGAVKGTREELERTAKQSKQTSKAVDDSGTSVGRLSTALKNHRSEWDQVGSSLLKTGAVLGAVTVLVGKAAMEWETAWTGVLKTVDGTPAELAAIEDGLRGLATSMPESHTNIAAVAEAAGQLGVASDDVVDFTRIMVMLGDTTNLSADEAATSIAQLMNVMQTAPEDVDRLGATLVDLGNKGASTERDIIQMAQRIAGAGEIVGMSEANVLSLANALASSGIEVEAGGSAISNVLIDISKAVDTGSDKLDLFAKTAGMSADDFSAKWKADPASALADFTEGLGRLDAQGESAFLVLDQLGQSDVRVTRALLNMANAGDLLRTSIADGDAAWEQNTALAVEAGKRYDTTAAQAEIAWNNIKDNAIDAGQALLPIVSAVSDVVVQLAEAFGSLPDPVKAGLGVIAGGAGVALVTVGGFMKLVGAVSDYRAATSALASDAPGTAMAMGKVSKAIGLATVALGAYYALQATQTGGDDVAGVSKYASALLDVANGGDKAAKAIEQLATINGKDPLAAIGGNPGSDVDGVKDMFDKGRRNKLQSIGNNITPYDDAYDTAVKGITQVDNALTSLVADGAADQAAKAFEYLSETTGRSTDELKEQLPGYAEAVSKVAVEQKLAAESSEDLEEHSLAMSMRLAQLSPDAKEAEKALQKMHETTQANAASFFDFTTNLKEAELSFAGWLDQLEESRKAQDEWADNLIKATARGVDEGVIDKLEAAGPEGAQLLAELADATEDEVDRVNAAYGDIGATAAQVLDDIPSEIITEFRTPGADDAVQTAIDLAVQYGMTPDQVQTILAALDYASDDIDEVLDGLGVVDGKTVTAKIAAEAEAAKTAVSSFITMWNSINPFKTVTIRTVRTGDDAGKEARAPRADGGPIVGTGGPKQDNIPIAASVGEHMWTAREVANAGGHGAMYAMRAEARAGNRPRYAVGGAVDDAWNEAYRSAAAAYGAPVASQAAGGSQTVNVTASMPGDLIDYDRLATALARRPQILQLPSGGGNQRLLNLEG